jgi:hypothetical protein
LRQEYSLERAGDVGQQQVLHRLLIET